MGLEEIKKLLKEVKSDNVMFVKKTGVILGDIKKSMARVDSEASALNLDLKRFEADSVAEIDEAIMDFVTGE